MIPCWLDIPFCGWGNSYCTYTGWLSNIIMALMTGRVRESRTRRPQTRESRCLVTTITMLICKCTGPVSLLPERTFPKEGTAIRIRATAAVCSQNVTQQRYPPSLPPTFKLSVAACRDRPPEECNVLKGSTRTQRPPATDGLSLWRPCPAVRGCTRPRPFLPNGSYRLMIVTVIRWSISTCKVIGKGTRTDILVSKLVVQANPLGLVLD